MDMLSCIYFNEHDYPVLMCSRQLLILSFFYEPDTIPIILHVSSHSTFRKIQWEGITTYGYLPVRQLWVSNQSTVTGINSQSGFNVHAFNQKAGLLSKINNNPYRMFNEQSNTMCFCKGILILCDYLISTEFWFT